MQIPLQTIPLHFLDSQQQVITRLFLPKKTIPRGKNAPIFHVIFKAIFSIVSNYSEMFYNFHPTAISSKSSEPASTNFLFHNHILPQVEIENFLCRVDTVDMRGGTSTYTEPFSCDCAGKQASRQTKQNKISFPLKYRHFCHI